MRVISGTARGRKLKTPGGFDIRPTSDIVKESIFNIIQFDIEGRKVLDLFAGTGQLGIEALSRGAESVTFVDSKRESAELVRENLKLCGFADSAVVYCCDALAFLNSNERFDLIFLDPPYDLGTSVQALQKIVEFDKLNEHGIIICETKEALPESSPPFGIFKEYKYGGVRITKYGK
ncbi:MAG: 16S rRNA (guanine(966)-N(2))-methyltransferase RsmD [Oscillospiraceae bacterium]|nr:16S rRNA (guanine(966)-N(2))-methyltransferase RsmD [Oscillospiraceae bacterium]